MLAQKWHQIGHVPIAPGLKDIFLARAAVSGEDVKNTRAEKWFEIRGASAEGCVQRAVRGQAPGARALSHCPSPPGSASHVPLALGGREKGANGLYCERNFRLCSAKQSTLNSDSFGCSLFLSTVSLGYRTGKGEKEQ